MILLSVINTSEKSIPVTPNLLSTQLKSSPQNRLNGSLFQ